MKYAPSNCFLLNFLDDTISSSEFVNSGQLQRDGGSRGVSVL